MVLNSTVVENRLLQSCHISLPIKDALNDSDLNCVSSNEDHEKLKLDVSN